jgi:hypothetical protein
LAKAIGRFSFITDAKMDSLHLYILPKTGARIAQTVDFIWQM